MGKGGGIDIDLFIIFTDFYHSCSSYFFLIRQYFKDFRLNMKQNMLKDFSLNMKAKYF